MTLCSPAVEATKTWVRWCGDELGFNHVEEAIGSVLAQTWKDCRGRQRKGPRNYTADERAKVLGMTYAERQLLRLRRTGAIDVD